MYLRFWLVKECIPQIFFAQNTDAAKRKPQKRKRQADLPHKIHRHGRIVPDVQMHDLIDDYAGPEFKKSHNQRSNRHLSEQGQAEMSVETADDIEAQPSQQKHASMRPAAPEQLHAAVKHTADVENNAFSPEAVSTLFHNDPSVKNMRR